MSYYRKISYSRSEQGLLWPPAPDVDMDDLAAKLDQLIVLAEEFELTQIYKSDKIRKRIDKLVSIWNSEYIDEDVHRLVVKTIRPYLDMDVEAFFSKAPKLLYASRRFVQHGKLYLGHVVQMRRDEVLELFDGKEKLVSAFETSLSETGFSFDMHTGDWKPPVREPYRCR